MLVDFQATFDEEIGENYALDALRNATKDGTLGKFKVEEDSPRLLGHAQSTAAPAPKTEQATGEVDLTPTRETPSSPWTDEGWWYGFDLAECKTLTTFCARVNTYAEMSPDITALVEEGPQIAH